MKKYLLLLVMALSIGASSASKKIASFTGYISCAKCGDASKEPGGIAKHAACSAACVKGGEAVVLVTSDNKVLKISNQKKALAELGKKVSIEGTLKDDTIEIKSIKAI